MNGCFFSSKYPFILVIEHITFGVTFSFAKHDRPRDERHAPCRQTSSNLCETARHQGPFHHSLVEHDPPLHRWSATVLGSWGSIFY